MPAILTSYGKNKEEKVAVQAGVSRFLGSKYQGAGNRKGPKPPTGEDPECRKKIKKKNLAKKASRLVKETESSSTEDQEEVEGDTTEEEPESDDDNN
jgi:hypothetical protein